MCFNKEVSILVFLIGIFSSIKFLLMANDFKDKVNRNRLIGAGIFTLFLSIMQLVDFFLWLSIERNNRTMNIASLGVMFVLFIQIVATLGSVLGLNLGTDKEKLTVIVCASLFIFFSFYTCLTTFNRKVVSTVDSSTHRLNWGIFSKIFKTHGSVVFVSTFILYMICVFLATWLVFGYGGLIIFLGSFVLAGFYALYVGVLKKVSVIGSLWCSMSVILLGFALLVDEKYFKNLE